MATVLDIGLVNYFNIIFTVLFIWAIIFALLQKTKVIGDSLGINATVAIAVAFMSLLSSTLIQVVNFMVPWFAVAIIFFVLMILIFQMFGVTDFSGAVKDEGLLWAIIGIGLVIMVVAFANVLGQGLLDQAAGQDQVVSEDGTVSGGDFEGNIYSTLFHPKVLGLIILFIVAIFAVILLSSGVVRV